VSLRVSPIERVRAEIDELFGSDRELGGVLEEVARLGCGCCRPPSRPRSPSFPVSADWARRLGHTGILSVRGRRPRRANGDAAVARLWRIPVSCSHRPRQLNGPTRAAAIASRSATECRSHRHTSLGCPEKTLNFLPCGSKLAGSLAPARQGLERDAGRRHR
jgi:hypothetical protein